jgi:iron(III) transport system permease protein
MSRGSIPLAALLWSVIAFLVIYPLAILLVESFKIASTGGWGIDNYLEFFQDAYYIKTFGNTLLLSTLVLLTTTVFGVPLAYILARYRHRGKTVFTALILLPIVLPAFAGVFAFIIFFGKYGSVNLLLMDLGLIEKPLNFIYGLHGLVFVQSLHMLPFIVLGLSAGFTNIDPSFEEAAEVEGASGFRRFITITLPLCSPSYLAGAVLVFLWPFTDWLTPLILGQVDFLPSVSYINISYHFTDAHRKHMGIVAVVLSAIVCITLFLLARWWVERKKYTGLSKGTTSEGTRHRAGTVGKVWIICLYDIYCAPGAADSGCAGTGRFFQKVGFRGISHLLDFGQLQADSFGKPGPDKKLLSVQRDRLGFRDCLRFAGGLSHRPHPHAGQRCPGLCHHLDAGLPGHRHRCELSSGILERHPPGHYWIIMPLALFARRLPYFLRMAHSSYLQLDPSLEEASEVSGAGKIRTFFLISLPLLLKGVLVGVVMFFIMAFQEISTAVFLYKGGWETLPIGIYLNWHRGMEFGIAAAMAFLMIVITFILLLIISKISGGVLKAAWGSKG